MRRGFLAFGVVLIAAAGCTAGHDASARSDPLAAITSTVGPTRSAVLDVPAGMHLNSVQYGDATHGYALVMGATDGLLFATADGGRTWARLALPQSRLTNPALTAFGPARPIIHADEGWFVSSDFGGTFRHDQPDAMGEYIPPEFFYRPYDGLYASGDCTPGPCFDLTEHTSAGDQRVSMVGTVLPAPEAATYGPDGRWWAFALDGPRVTAAVSADRGATWQARPVPAHPLLDGAPERIGALRTVDGTDTWLIGEGGDPMVGALGRSLSGRLAKGLDLPVFWLLRGDQWVPQRAEGRPSQRVGSSWAAVGGRMIIAAGLYGIAVMDARWTPINLPTPVDYVRRLADGSVVAGVLGTPAPSYMGTLSGRHLTWTPLELKLSR